MKLICKNCGHEFDPTKTPGKPYQKIASTYPCPKCGKTVQNPAVSGN